jgi:hypothetical protein
MEGLFCGNKINGYIVTCIGSGAVIGANDKKKAKGKKYVCWKKGLFNTVLNRNDLLPFAYYNDYSQAYKVYEELNELTKMVTRMLWGEEEDSARQGASAKPLN